MYVLVVLSFTRMLCNATECVFAFCCGALAGMYFWSIMAEAQANRDDTSLRPWPEKNIYLVKNPRT